jgi:hypothetical protein
MTWTLTTAGSWGVATTNNPAADLAAALALPGSWRYDTNPLPGGTQRLFVRKDQWGSLAAIPTVERLNPTSGTAAGGTGVQVIGDGLIGSTGVTFGGTAATGFLVNSDALVTCISPAHAAGPVTVVVANPRGNVTLPNGYTFV